MEKEEEFGNSTLLRIPPSPVLIQLRTKPRKMETEVYVSQLKTDDRKYKLVEARQQSSIT